ncbi:MAG: radical SAM family heme chaperone HemW, partial [Flavobacteriales bacterium]|nr:radical SAM family heme chaperone HemW [Flavobacteriales bacterium]
SIADKIHGNYRVAPGVEFTLEANPDDLDADRLKAFKDAGVNRLSIGIQSFSDKSLKWMNRAHNAKEALNCLALAHEAGFNNISIDLIYGLPQLTKSVWKEELKRVVDLNIQHVSAYCLTVEAQTALGHWVKKGKEKPVDEEAAKAQFEMLIEGMDAAGLEQYEVSNFAREGFHSRHNSAYWHGEKYIGLGPAAHSFNGIARSWNVSNNALYLKALHENSLPSTAEDLTLTDRFNEWVMTGLRTSKGIDLQMGKKRFDIDIAQNYRNEIDKLIENEMADIHNSRLALTRKGLFFADGIAADFFILNHEN